MAIINIHGEEEPMNITGFSLSVDGNIMTTFIDPGIMIPEYFHQHPQKKG